MRLHVPGIAGSMESGDILIEMENVDQPGVEIELQSTVGNQYGKQIKAVIKETIEQSGVDGVRVRAVDKGALDCTIRARVGAAVYRGLQSDAFIWE